jgi:trimethylamine--corrinoid protein Co-methyltransferase
MAVRPLVLPPPRILTDAELERIHEAAVRILTELGLRVYHEEARQLCLRAGMRVEGERVFPDKQRIEELLARTRRGWEEEAAGPSTSLSPGPEPRLTLSVPMYCEFVHDLETDEVVPFTRERLIEATKFVDTMAGRGVTGAAPGIPQEVPPALHRLEQYRIGARYSRHGRRPVMEELSPRAFPYLMDMAEALGHPVRGHVIYVISPLALSRESLEGLTAILPRLESVSVSNMLSVGGTAPVRLPQALALAAAEAMGASIVVAAFSGLPVDWGVRVCPFDPRTMAMSLGSPEELLFQRASDEVTAWYHGWDPGPPSGMIHSQAKLPDAQAAAERMCQMTMAALCGARDFYGGGALSLDEVFSAEQLMIDCEIRDHLQRLVRGTETECDPEACLAEVAAGLEGGFLGLESTASRYRQIYWLPRLFERRRFTGWQEAGRPRLGDRAKEMVREQLKQHDYELAPELWRELDRIYARAERELV